VFQFYSCRRCIRGKNKFKERKEKKRSQRDERKQKNENEESLCVSYVKMKEEEKRYFFNTSNVLFLFAFSFY
jgi:hypothetical protein